MPFLLGLGFLIGKGDKGPVPFPNKEPILSTSVSPLFAHFENQPSIYFNGKALLVGIKGSDEDGETQRDHK